MDLITAIGWENTHEGKDFSRFSLSSRVTRFDKLREERESQMVSVTQFGRVRGCSICTTSTVAKNHVCMCVCTCVKWRETVCVYM